MKASEIIDCTCTVVSISSISSFACANVWSVRVFTSSIYVTFIGVRFCIRQYLSKKGKKNKKWDLVFIQKSYMYMYRKKLEYSFAIFWFHAILGLDP